MDKTANKSQSKKIKAAIFGGIVLLAVIGFAVPLLMSDGTEKFSGIEQQVAQDTIKDYPIITQGLSPKYNLKHRVDKISEMPLATAKESCNLLPGDDGTGNYIVTLSTVSLFGFPNKTFERYACVSMNEFNSEELETFRMIALRKLNLEEINNFKQALFKRLGTNRDESYKERLWNDLNRLDSQAR